MTLRQRVFHVLELSDLQQIFATKPIWRFPKLPVSEVRKLGLRTKGDLPALRRLQLASV